MPTVDNYPTSKGVATPSKNFRALTPSDTVDFTEYPKAILIGGADGVATVVPEVGDAVVMYFLRGHVYPIRPRRVNATALAANMTIIGLY